VLVVDDNRTNQIICEEMLTNWGMAPTAVDSGKQGLEEFDRAVKRNEPYRLALVDVMMPGMDGFEMVRQLRKRPEAESLSIIVLSSADRPHDKATARELGIARCLTKPVTQSDLLNCITTALGTALAEDDPAADSLIDHGPGPFSPLNILLAEDGAVNRKVAVSLLEKRGHRVTAVEDGQLAVDQLRRQPFDLVLMDVQMPVLDGFAATAAIREMQAPSGKHTPIIAMTAHAMQGDRQRCLDAGMDDYVSKPFRPQELFEVVEKTTPSQTGEAPPYDSSDEANLNEASNPDESGSLLLRQDARPTEGASEPKDSGSLLPYEGAHTSGPSKNVAKPQATSPPAKSAGEAAPFDYDRALENVGGSKRVLEEMIELLAVEAPKQMADIETAYDSGDNTALLRAAHTLKGSVALFAADPATAAAKKIELMGRDGKLDNYSAAWDDLEQRVEELLTALGATRS
jgi:CheY-like chemotaxis protein